LLPSFPGVPVVVLAQDVLGAIRGALVPFNGDVSGKDEIRGYLTTSEAADAAVATFSESPRWFVPQMFEPGAFRYVEDKKKQVVYMNRKRPDEVAMLRAYMRKELAARGFDLLEVHNIPTKAEVLNILAESLVFVSLSRQEGFGMPPAEAMAMGCIAVGYTGVGGNEFFTPDVGVPVPDDDIVGLYRKVLEVVGEYNEDPSRLDDMRRRASDRMLATYVRENTARALLKAVEELAI
jgi:glycosyltransferase involved in cell wall biosynthesis